MYVKRKYLTNSSNACQAEIINNIINMSSGDIYEQ